MDSHARFDKEKTVHVSLKFNRNTDKDILEKLSSVGSKQGYIKQLIREDIKRSQG